jgi:hypothetical protein
MLQSVLLPTDLFHCGTSCHLNELVSELHLQCTKSVNLGLAFRGLGAVYKSVRVSDLQFDENYLIIYNILSFSSSYVIIKTFNKRNFKL